jgi:hypothetical protein
VKRARDSRHVILPFAKLVADIFDKHPVARGQANVSAPPLAGEPCVDNGAVVIEPDLENVAGEFDDGAPPLDQWRFHDTALRRKGRRAHGLGLWPSPVSTGKTSAAGSTSKPSAMRR